MDIVVSEVFAAESKFQTTVCLVGSNQGHEGILRCKGRHCNSSLPESAKFPSRLPCDHHITRLTSRDSRQGEQSSALDIRERVHIYGVLYNACFP